MTTAKTRKASRGRTPTGQPNPIDVHVGNRIRLRRTLLGLSQEKLASLLGLTFQQVQKYERGMNRVGASRLWDIGKVLNRGVEVSLNAYLIRNTESNIFWSVGGNLAYNKNTIKEIDESLDYLNDELLDEDGANPSFLYKEGESMNTIYAVRSLGINPANGKEMFLKLDGTRTYEWDAQDKVACGVNEPKVFGNLNTFFQNLHFYQSIIEQFHSPPT